MGFDPSDVSPHGWVRKGTIAIIDPPNNHPHSEIWRGYTGVAVELTQPMSPGATDIRVRLPNGQKKRIHRAMLRSATDLEKIKHAMKEG